MELDDGGAKLQGYTALTLPISTATQTALDGKATTAQGAKADTAVQPSDLGALATKSKVATIDIDAVGSTANGALLTRGGEWVATTGSYGDLSGKPATFPPSAHTHTPSEVGLGNVVNKSEAQMVAAGAIADAINAKYELPSGGTTNQLIDATGLAIPKVGLPISTATQNALNGKASLSGANFTGNVKLIGSTISVKGNIPGYYLESPTAAYAYTMSANISDTVYGSWRVQAGFSGSVLFECFGV